MPDLEAAPEQEGMRMHTPGPWTFDPNQPTNSVFAGSMRICDIRGWGHLTGRGAAARGLGLDEAAKILEANARLIAAAPDLRKSVEALRYLVLCMATGPGWTPELVIEILTGAEAALAEAGVPAPAGQWDFLKAGLGWEPEIDLRPAVRAFAEAMEMRLRANDHKPGWEGEPWTYLLPRLQNSVHRLWHKSSYGASPALITECAADVANYAMMFSDNASETE